MNKFGYQEFDMTTHMQPAAVTTAKETCLLCKHTVPFGCDDCRKEVAAENDDVCVLEADGVETARGRTYIGGGEVMPDWLFA